MKIRVLRKNKNLELPKIIDKGDWIDLRLSETTSFKAPYANMLRRKTKDNNTFRTRDIVFDNKTLSLGIAMELPKGFEAQVLPRSSTFRKYGLILTNSEGIIDYSYRGNNDVWGANVLAFKNSTIPEGERLFQFKIVLSQKATPWQRIKWLFNRKIEFIEVDNLGNEDRHGFGEGTKDIK